ASARFPFGVPNCVRFRTLNPSNRISSVRRCSADTVKVFASDTFSLNSGKLRIFGFVFVMLPIWLRGWYGKKPWLVTVATSPLKLAVVVVLKYRSTFGSNLSPFGVARQSSYDVMYGRLPMIGKPNAPVNAIGNPDA